MVKADTTHALLGAGEGEVIEIASNRIEILVASPSQLVCDYSAAPGFSGPPLHVHPGFDETYLVLDGCLDVTVADERRELTAGEVAYVSGSVPHTFANASAGHTRFLSVCTPGGFERFFRAMASGDRQAIADASAQFGYEAVAR
jgi:mannose-6-phosphate isomerase-like protein (cupin superfamily)